MEKRTFLKLLAAAGPMSRALVSDVAAAAKSKMTNWSGNIEYGTDQVLEAHNLAQVRAMVAAQAKLRPLGTRHCFNRIADSKDALLTVTSMEEPIAVDAAAKTVTVPAGMKYGKLAPMLDAQGWALHNLASLPHISVAGSCSTATHGSGVKNGNLSTAVRGLELVTASGEVAHLTPQKDGEVFHGAVVSLGALGVITKVTLDIQPRYTMRQYVYENLPMEQVKNHFDAVMSSGYSVSLFTDWQKHRVNEVWVKMRGDAAGPEELYGAKRATKNLHPIAELSAENCTEQLGVAGPWYERLPHFKMGFTPSAGKELQSEFFVPHEHAVEAMLAIERLRDQITPHLMISEIRTIAADELWLSPAYKRASVALHFTWQPDWPAVSKLLPVIERELGPFQPRPHWGKLFTMKPKYERMPEFLALTKRFDPTGKFRNDFLNANVFSAS